MSFIDSIVYGTVKEYGGFGIWQRSKNKCSKNTYPVSVYLTYCVLHQSIDSSLRLEC